MRPSLAHLCLLSSLLTPAIVTAVATADDTASTATTPWRVTYPEIVLDGVPFQLIITDTSGTGCSPVLRSQQSDGAPLAFTPPEPDLLADGRIIYARLAVQPDDLPLVLVCEGVRQEVPMRILPGWLSLLPPILAIGLALLTRQVIVALLLGVWVGSCILYNWNPLSGFLHLGDRFLVSALADEDHATILLFSTVLGGMVGILSRSGATEGIVQYLAGKVRGRRGGQLSTAMMGSVIFFDDYANTLLVGNTMRPLTDRLRISREKLAYIVDSTAAPVVTVAVVSTWVGFEVGLIQDAMTKLSGEGSAYTFFLRTIPYGFYPILTLFFVYLIAGLGRDYGAMLTAERRAFTTGALLREGAQPASDTRVFESVVGDRPPAHPLVATLPILLVIMVTGFGLWWNGLQELQAKGVVDPNFRQILNAADSYAVLMWAALSGALAAGVLVLATGRMNLRETVEGWVAGAKAMLIAVVILLLAWSLSEVCSVLQTANYLVEVCRQGLPAHLLPTVTFLLAAAIGFATGTSWGTMAILMPLIYPLGALLPGHEGLAAGVSQSIHLASVSAVLAGSVFGDHCSPISDTTILSSLASGSDHMDHVRTQLPYAATVGLVAIAVGYLPAGYGFPPALSLLAGALLLLVIVLWCGRKP